MKQKNQIILWIIIGIVAVLPVLLTQDYHGNRITHFIMEITGGFLALCVALFAANCSFERREGLTSYIMLGFLTAGLIDILHALSAMGIMLPPDASIEGFLSGTWTLGRTSLGIIILWGLVCTSRDRGFRPSTLWLTILPLIIIPSIIVLFASFPLPVLIVKELPLIHRPWEYVALILYIACVFVIFKGGERRNTQLLLPSLILGVITQLVMAFSLEPFKPSFDGSHLLKNVSYLAAAVAFGTLTWKRSRYSIEVSSARQLITGSIMFLLLSCSSVIALGLNWETEFRWTSYLLMGQLFVLIAFLPLLFIVVVAITSRQLKHISSLTEISKHVKSGGRSERVKVATEDEIGTLAMAFNDMLDSLETSQRKLQEANDRLELQVAERTDELNSSRQMLLEVLDTIPVRVFWKDLNSVYLGCNRLFARDAGLNCSEEIIGMNDANLVWADQAKLYHDDDRKVIESGMPKMYSEESRITSDGKKIWLLTSKVPLRDQRNNIIGILGTYDDITKRKKSEEEISKLVEIIRRSDDFISLASPEGQVIFVNDAGQKLIGLDSKEETLPKTIFEYFFETDAPFVREEILQTMFKKGLWKGEFRFRHFRSGTAIPIAMSVFTIISPKTDEILAVAMVCRDISKLKKYQEHLGRMVDERTEELRFALKDAELSRDRIDGILKSVADGLIVTDRFNRIILMNRAAENLLGVRLSEILDRPINFAIYDRELRENIMETLSSKKTSYEFDFKLQGTDPELLRIARASASPIFDKKGHQAGIVTTIHDVTHEREIDRMKTEFISMAAHELRTPLTSIRGFSEVLLTRKELRPGEKNKFLTYINEQSVKLGNIISDLLDISRIESGAGFTLNKVLCKAGETIKKITPYFEGISEIHTFDIALPEKPVELYMDQDKMEQALKNILGNAVKYSPRGGLIKIKGEILDGKYQVTVKDNGIGMTPEQVNKIFDKFFRADISNSAVEGTGLGMTIVKHIIEAHGGDVWVESKYGKGTTVGFRIPLITRHVNK